MLTIFGSIAVGIMFLSYLLERHSKWMVLVFALGISLDGGLQRPRGSLPNHSDRSPVDPGRPATLHPAATAENRRRADEAWPLPPASPRRPILPLVNSGD